MTVENYIDRVKERAFTIADNNIQDCQINYREVLLMAIVNNIVNVSYWFRDEFRIDFIDVFETDENFEPLEETPELLDKLDKIIGEINDRGIYDTIVYPVYKELWDIDYFEDVKKY